MRVSGSSECMLSLFRVVFRASGAALTTLALLLLSAPQIGGVFSTDPERLNIQSIDIPCDKASPGTPHCAPRQPAKRQQQRYKGIASWRRSQEDPPPSDSGIIGIY